MTELDKITVMWMSDRELERANLYYWKIDFPPSLDRKLVYHRRGLIMNEKRIRREYKDQLAKLAPPVQPG